MDFTLLPSLVGFAFISSMTPGPNNLLLLSSGAIFGWRRTLPMAAGVLVGFALLMTSAVVGLATLVARWPWLVGVARSLGAAWLAWLALRFFLAARRPSPDVSRSNRVAMSRPLRFHEALLFQWINPKAMILALSSSGAYVAIAAAPYQRALIIVGVFFLSGLVSCSTWMIAGDVLNRHLSSGPAARYISLTMALLILLTALQVLVGT